MSDKKFKCEICDASYANKSSIHTHQKNSESCIKLQLEKLGHYKFPEQAKIVIESKNNKKTKPRAPRKQKEPDNKDEKKVNKKYSDDDDDDDDDDISENDEIPLDSSSEDEDVEVKGLTSSSEDEQNSDKEDAINFFKNMGATKFDNMKTFKKKYTTVSQEVINDGVKTEEIKPDTKPVEKPKEEKSIRIDSLETKLNDVMKILVKVSDSISSLDNKINRLSADNEKKYKDIEKRIKDIDMNTIITKIEDVFGSTIENNVEISKKLLAEIDSKNETLEILKEDIDETCDKYYEVYKKFKVIKEDMEDMVHGRRNNYK